MMSLGSTGAAKLTRIQEPGDNSKEWEGKAAVLRRIQVGLGLTPTLEIPPLFFADGRAETF